MNNLCKWLADQNVRKIYFGAGSRNSVFIAGLEQFKHEYFFDERSLAFSALGEAKLTGNPIVVCLTSGTAVSEVFSAIIEAYYSEVKLIVISADRPKRLDNSFAPQCIIQKDIFYPYIKTAFDDEVKKFELSIPIDYPMHINIRIDDRELSSKYEEKLPIKKFAAVFTTGSDIFKNELEELLRKGVPILIESTSHFNPDRRGVIKEKDLEHLIKNNEIDSLVKFGHTPITKVWRDADRKYLNLNIFSYKNKKVGMGRGAVLESLESIKEQKVVITKTINTLNKLMNKYPNSEVALVNKFYEALPCDDLIYIGNSMPIRYYEMIWSGKNKSFASRGANGIDGQIATAIGMARVSTKTIHCLIGDITFLYDYNSLFTNIPENLKITIIDNNGGRIFERVSVSPKMIIENEINIGSLISERLKEKIEVLNPDLEETRKFWKEWNEV